MSNEQENFFDAVRSDPVMTPEQKAYWLQFEPVEPVDPEGDAAYWRARAEKAERAYKEIVENARETINGMMKKNMEMDRTIRQLQGVITKQEHQLNRILQPGERWLELLRQAGDENEHLPLGEWWDRYGPQATLAEQRVKEAIRDTLTEMVRR